MLHRIFFLHKNKLCKETNIAKSLLKDHKIAIDKQFRNC